METNADRRRRKLKSLCDTHGPERVAEIAGLSEAHLNQIQDGVLLPTKKDGTRSRRALGDDSARKIEAALNLPEGWFDNDSDLRRWPFSEELYSVVLKCSAADVFKIENVIRAALDMATLPAASSGKRQAA